MKKILLVEDDPEIVMLLHLHFSAPDYALTVCSQGKEAIGKAVNDYFDLIVLDITLPDIDGIEVCKMLVKKNVNRPIMMLTSRSEEIDKVLALELGADDYVTKPFSIRELQARVKALIRRSDQVQLTQTDCGSEVRTEHLYINKNERKASLQGRRLELTAKEFELLFLLASNRGKTFSRQELLELVWGYSFSGYEHTITSHINRLRIKIEPDFNQPRYIITTWGVGYRFTE